jgi:hypothetical protein
MEQDELIQEMDNIKGKLDEIIELQTDTSDESISN